MNIKKNIENLCPCKSGKTYGKCCNPYHIGKDAENALILMRSRYSAYAYYLTEYIIKTTHSSSPSFKDIIQWSKQISEFCLNTQFKDLKIISFNEKNDFATVIFFASLFQGLENVSFTEESLFEKVNGKWYYVNGKIQYNPKI